MALNSDRLDHLAAALIAAHPSNHSQRHGADLPNRETVAELCRQLLSLLFPGFFSKAHPYCGHIDTFTRQVLLEVEALLSEQVHRAQLFSAAVEDCSAPPDLKNQVREQTHEFLERLPRVAGLITTDVQASFENDPAAASHAEIIAAYPGIEAIAVQRLAHELYLLQVPLIPRMMTEVAHSSTGIDIHPGARIGPHFAIDHGTGIVIGETCIIGAHCMLYHGVTLGAFNPLSRNDAGELRRGARNKRHPDLEDHVRVYPGATILGGDTRVGHHSVIGGNVWLTHSVEAYSKVTLKDPELRVSTANSLPAPNFTI